jgi:hypothetical protein
MELTSAVLLVIASSSLSAAITMIIVEGWEKHRTIKRRLNF